MVRPGIIVTASFIFFIMGFAVPGFCQEKNYRVEVLQITNIEELQSVYNGFLRELDRAGISLGKNLTVNRTIIDFDIENPSLAKKINVYFKIKSEAARIVKEKPDLVLTMGTPVTRYAKDKIVAAGIPLVFTALAFPETAGCKSLTEAGHGFTGATTHMSMRDALRTVKLALPAVKTLGIVCSDDANSLAHVDEAKKEGQGLGITIISKQVGMKAPIAPALKELQKQGVQAFAVPPDPYYELHGHLRAAELIEFSKASRTPVVSFVIDKIPGAALYVGVDFDVIGELSGRQAVQILKDGVKPDALPILRQQDLTIMVDTMVVKDLNIQMPQEILHAARPLN